MQHTYFHGRTYKIITTLLAIAIVLASYPLALFALERTNKDMAQKPLDTAFVRLDTGTYATSSVTGLLEWKSDETVTAPRQWQSDPSHPMTTLTYITEVEMALLKKLDLHDSGVDVEDHFGPEGIPSLNGGGSAVGSKSPSGSSGSKAGAGSSASGGTSLGGNKSGGNPADKASGINSKGSAGGNQGSSKSSSGSSGSKSSNGGNPADKASGINSSGSAGGNQGSSKSGSGGSSGGSGSGPSGGYGDKSSLGASPASQARAAMDKAASAVGSFFSGLTSLAGKSAVGKSIVDKVTELKNATKAAMNALGVTPSPTPTYTSLPNTNIDPKNFNAQKAADAAAQQKAIQDRINGAFGTPQNDLTKAYQDYARSRIAADANKQNKSDGFEMDKNLQDILGYAGAKGVDTSDFSVVSALGSALKGSTPAEVKNAIEEMQKKDPTAVNKASNKIGLGIVGCAGGGCTTDQKNAQTLMGLAKAPTPEVYAQEYAKQVAELTAIEKAGYIANELFGVGPAQADDINPNTTAPEINISGNTHVTDDKKAYDAYQAAVADLDTTRAATSKDIIDAYDANAPQTTIDAKFEKLQSIDDQKRDIAESMFGVRADKVSFSNDKSKTEDTKTQTASAPNPQNTNTSPAPSKNTPSNTTPTAPSKSPSAQQPQSAPESNVEKQNPNLATPKTTLASKVVAGTKEVITKVGNTVKALTGTGGSQTDTRGLRNNNPGNIDQGQNFVGEVPSTDSRFAQFEAPEFGIRAIYKVQKTYEDKHGLETIEGRIARWAPPNENNTKSYIKTVADKMGIPADTPFSITDPVLGQAFVEAVIGVENGKNPYTTDQISVGQKLAFGDEEDSISTASYTNDAPGFTVDDQTTREAEARSNALQEKLNAYGDSREAARMAQEAVARDIKDQLERRCTTCKNVSTVYSAEQDNFDVTFTDSTDPKDTVSFNDLPETAQADKVKSTVATLKVRKEIVAGRAFETYDNEVSADVAKQNAPGNPSGDSNASIEDTAKYWSKGTFDSVIANLSSKTGTTNKTGATNKTGYVNPVTGTLDLGNTPQYGQDTRTSSLGIKTRDHAGVDIYAQTDSGRLTGPDAVVKAAIGGTVVRSQKQDGYGNTIDILGDDGKVQRYAHVSGKTPDGKDVVVGQRFETGQDLTTITGSGTQFDAKAIQLGSLKAAEDYYNKNGWASVNKPHLHFEIRNQSSFGFKGTIDPTAMLPDLQKGSQFAAGDPGVETEGSISTASTDQPDAKSGLVTALKDLRDKKFGSSDEARGQGTPQSDEDSDTAQNPQTDENLGSVGLVRNLEIKAKLAIDKVADMFGPKGSKVEQNPNTDENLGSVGFVRNLQLTAFNGIKSVWNGIKNIFGGSNDGTNTNTQFDQGSDHKNTASSTASKKRADGKYVVEDVEVISVHFGLNIGCPDSNGVAQNGYIYTLKFQNKQASSERSGCGLETPYVYTTNIANDLEQNSNFAPIDVDELFKKMKFKFYNGTE